MKVSDTILSQPVALADAELDAVSAGITSRQQNPLRVLLADIKRVEETILSDLGLGGAKRA